MRRMVLAAAALVLPIAAHADPDLVASTPAANASVMGGNVAIRLRYNTAIDHAASLLRLQGPGGVQAPLQIDPASPPDSLWTETSLMPGGYEVLWQARATGGGVSAGAVPFTVTPNE